MKRAVEAWLKKAYKDMITVIGLCVIVTLLLFCFYDIPGRDMSVPIMYGGGDEMSFLNTVRFVQGSGWNWGTDRLSATDEYYYNNKEILSGLHNSDVALAGFGLLVTGGDDVGLAANVGFLAIYYLTVLVCYWALRLLKIRQWIAASGSLVFGFMSFAFMRGMAHIGLTCYFFVPLAVLMAVWLYEDEKFMHINRDFFRYRRNYLGLIMCFLVATQGLGYWQLFACCFIFLAAIMGALRNKKISYLYRGITCVICIVISVVICCIPVFITMSVKDLQTAVRFRGGPDAENYGLKIIQLFLPVNDHGISFLEMALSEYNKKMPLVNENASSYLGLAGIIGFVILILYIFKENRNDTSLKKRLSILADMNLCAVLFSVIGGFGAMLYLALFRVLGGLVPRCFNRVSVFIACICLFALCLVTEECYKKLKKSSLKYVAGVLFCGFMMFALWEQNPGGGTEYADSEARWYSDKAFITEVEKNVNEDDKVFMLPYVQYPEPNLTSSIGPYDHFLGFIHSDKVRWSYATVAGSDNDEWCMETAQLEPFDMVKEIKEKGFSGVYIDRAGYSDGEWQVLEAELELVLKSKPIVSDNKRLSFFIIP